MRKVNKNKLTVQQQIDVYREVNGDSNLQKIADFYKVPITQISKLFYQKIEDMKHDKKFHVGLAKRTCYYDTEEVISGDTIYDPADLVGEELKIFNEL